MADELDIDALLEDAFKKSERNGERSKKSDNDRKTDDKKKSDSKRSDDRKRKSEERDRDSRRKSRDRDIKRRSDDDRDDDRKKRKRSKDNHSDRRRRSKSRSKSRSRDKSRNKDKSKNRDKSRSRDRSKNRDKSSRDRSRSRDKSKSRREKDREREERQKEREKEREKEKEEREKREKEREKEREERRKEREKEREKEKEERKKREEIERGRNVAKLEDDSRRRSRDRRRSSSRGKRDSPEMTVEERDVRTVFCMQLSPRIRPRDLEEFFSSVGKVRDVRLILDNKSHRSKGIAYIEFRDIESVALAIGLSGQKLLGVPIIVQNAHAERNRQASTNQPASVTLGGGGSSSPKPPPVPEGPGRLYVGLLHPNITEEMLSGLFEPFGKLLELKLVKDPSSGKSAGYGFITYALTEDAKKAMGQFNGFQLAGKAIKVGFVTEKTTEILTFDAEHPKPTHSTSTGFNLGPTERLQLMAKLAEGTGMQLPAAATTAISASNQAVTPPIATQCFMLSNMFDLKKQNAPNWKEELRDDIIEECNKHGGLIHMVIDETSDTGNVYVKCPSVVSAAAVVNALHGRYFAGQVITAAYVPLPNYHTLFPESITSTQLLQPSLLYNNHM